MLRKLPLASWFGKKFLALVVRKNSYSHFLLAVISHCMILFYKLSFHLFQLSKRVYGGNKSNAGNPLWSEEELKITLFTGVKMHHPQKQTNIYWKTYVNSSMKVNWAAKQTIHTCLWPILIFEAKNYFHCAHSHFSLK